MIDSGCTNHITRDKTLFKDLKPTKVSEVKIGNGSYIAAKGKGAIIISRTSCMKTISDVLYVPNIDQNLLSVGQLIEKGFKLSFEDQHCAIFDTTGQEILKVKIRLKTFSFDPPRRSKQLISPMLVRQNFGTSDLVIVIFREC